MDPMASVSSLTPCVHDFVSGFVAGHVRGVDKAAARRAILLVHFEARPVAAVARELGLAETSVRRMAERFREAFRSWAQQQLESGRALAA